MFPLKAEKAVSVVCRVVDTLVKTRGQQALRRRRRGGDNTIIHLVSGSLKRLYTM